jgi:hypothetical protein
MSTANKVKLELAITIEYQRYETPIAVLEKLMKLVAENAYGDGHFTGSHTAEIQSFRYSITRKHYTR